MQAASSHMNYLQFPHLCACLPRSFIRARAGVGLGHTVIFRAVKTDSRKLQERQVETGFDYGIGKEGADRGDAQPHHDGT